MKKEMADLKNCLKVLEKEYESTIFDYSQEIIKAKKIYTKILDFLDETNINLEGFDYTDEYLESMNDEKSMALKEYGYKQALERFKKEFELRRSN